MPDLLIELFSEEIPARMQARAQEDLKRLVTDGLVEAGLTYRSAGAFSTPRRLTLAIEELTAQSRPLREERKGPRTDAPSAALEGFLRATGLPLAALERRAEKKGETFYAVIETPGRPAAAIVAEVLERVIRGFPWPKSMRWGSGSLRWVRPLHTILALLSDETGTGIVPLEIDGIAAGDSTEGHRFMGAGRFRVAGFEDYAARLRAAKVVLDAQERAATIWHDATTLAFARGREVVEDAGLLAEVAGLVEWPVVLMGDIAEEFLGLPPEVLRTSMKEHQKFFSVRNPASGRIEGFVTVANRETADGGATILKGNLKVLSARLSDARFFWENDLRRVRAEGLEGMGAGLANVTFHNRLGSQGDRIGRIAALAAVLAPAAGADPALATQAARVAKADLRSEMVYEFPELQGVMGRYYAAIAGLPEAVADACRDHYAPLGPSDAVPTAPVTVAVALADKLDTLAGFWAIGETPTGSKDPFALRRAALGVIRLVLENGLSLPLRPALGAALGAHGVAGAQAQEIAGDLLGFLHDRLKGFLRERGLRHDVIEAVLGHADADDLARLTRRAEALAEVLGTAEGTNLIQGYKRAANILAQAEAKDGVDYSFGPDPKFAEDDAERALFAALDAAEAAIGPALAAQDFRAAMAAIAALRAPVDRFFEAVQVNAENPIVRRNRLNLLGRIRDICRPVADLGLVEG